MNKPVKTILIIDDESFVRQSLCDYFEDNLFRVVEADSGEKALELLEKEPANAAIVDVRMGGMNGDTFISKALVQKSDTAFVICTGSPDYFIPEDLQKLYSVSNRLFRKPVTNMDELKQEIISMIEIVDNKKYEN